MRDVKKIYQTTKNLSLLFVEDDMFVQESSLNMFENFFHDVALAKNGLEALELFEKKHYDLVITDISMPKMDGFELIRRIKEIKPDISVVVYSAWDDISYINKCISLHIDAYMKKPLSTDNLLDAIYKVSLRFLDSKESFKSYFDIDALTGLKSHNLFLEEFKTLHHQEIPVMLLLDLDQFHIYNEIYGLDIGDALLQGFAKLLEQFSKEFDYSLYRFAGDEFVLFEKTYTLDPDRYIQEVEALFELIEKNPIFVEKLQKAISLEVTLGISFQRENLYGKAQMALREARKRGRKYLGFSAEADISAQLKNNLFWREEIDKALANKTVHTFYHPIVDANEKILRYEALMRMKQIQDDGSCKVIEPGRFIDFSKMTKQYIELTKIVINESFETMLKYNVDISINITYHDIENREINKLLREKISKHHLANKTKFDISSQVIFELLEHANADDYEKLLAFIDEFKALGVLITIDNFGMGFANMSKIAAISPNYIKIDSTLMKNIDTDDHARSLVSAIVKFTKELHIKTIAEHVSNATIFKIAKDLGVDEFQGYYFSEPLENIYLDKKD